MKKLLIVILLVISANSLFAKKAGEIQGWDEPTIKMTSMDSLRNYYESRLNAKEDQITATVQFYFKDGMKKMWVGTFVGLVLGFGIGGYVFLLINERKKRKENLRIMPKRDLGLG